MNKSYQEKKIRRNAFVNSQEAVRYRDLIPSLVREQLRKDYTQERDRLSAASLLGFLIFRGCEEKPIQIHSESSGLTISHNTFSSIMGSLEKNGYITRDKTSKSAYFYKVNSYAEILAKARNNSNNTDVADETTETTDEVKTVSVYKSDDVYVYDDDDAETIYPCDTEENGAEIEVQNEIIKRIRNKKATKEMAVRNENVMDITANSSELVKVGNYIVDTKVLFVDSPSKTLEVFRVCQDSPNFLISNMARAYDMEKCHFLKSYGKEETPYLSWYLGPFSQNELEKNKYKRDIHRVVAKEFCEKPDTVNALDVDHIDGNTRNNLASNLRWVTHSENLTSQDVQKRSKETKQRNKEIKELRDKCVDYEGEIRMLKARLKNKDVDIEYYRSKIYETDDYKTLNDEKNELKNMVGNLQAEISTLNNAKNALQDENKRLLQIISRLREENEGLKKDSETIKSRIASIFN